MEIDMAAKKVSTFGVKTSLHAVNPGLFYAPGEKESDSTSCKCWDHS